MVSYVVNPTPRGGELHHSRGRNLSVRLTAVSITILAGLLTWAEWVHWRAGGRRLGNLRHEPGKEAVVVLGFKNRGTRANYMNRYRVRAGLRSMNPAASESALILCGGSVGSSVSEAELMARYACDELGYTGPVRLDCDSRTTWENIRNAIPLIDEFDTIKIASNSLHAEKGRAYLWKQRPDLAERLARADEYRFGEITFFKPLAAFVGLKNLRAHGRKPTHNRAGAQLRGTTRSVDRGYVEIRR